MSRPLRVRQALPGEPDFREYTEQDARSDYNEAIAADDDDWIYFVEDDDRPTPEAEASVSDERHPFFRGSAKPVFGSFASGVRDGALHEAATSLAKKMISAQNQALEDGIAALLRAGVPIERIEVVHETYSKGDDHTTIHQRAYVRVREAT